MYLLQIISTADLIMLIAAVAMGGMSIIFIRFSKEWTRAREMLAIILLASFGLLITVCGHALSQRYGLWLGGWLLMCLGSYLALSSVVSMLRLHRRRG